jgi:cell division protein FtsB
VQTLEDHSQTL